MAKEVRVAIVGVGNCASSVVQGLEFYRKHGPDAPGVMNFDLGGYRVTDIVPVCAFDIDRRKIGKDLSEAIFARPNIAWVRPDLEIPELGVPVQMGPPLDGVGEGLKDVVEVAHVEPVDVVKALRDSGAEVMINLLPTGGNEASRFYADAAIRELGIAYVNGMPANIVCNPEYQKAARESGSPMIGDDVKSQLGGTIVHRALAKTFVQRGVGIGKTYQINYAGNTDFANLVVRGASKQVGKKAAVFANVPYELNMSAAFCFVENMGDRKTAQWDFEGFNFGGAPLKFHAIMEVEDSPNFGGTMVEMIRYAKIALDRGVSGELITPSAFCCKQPPEQIDDDLCEKLLIEFVEGKRER